MKTDQISEIKEHLKSLTKLVKELSLKTNKQIQSEEEKDRIAAHIYSWFQSYRNMLASIIETSDLEEMDSECQKVLEAISKDPSRKSVCETILRIKSVYERIISSKKYLVDSRDDQYPDFKKLTQDSTIEMLLRKRWEECSKCVKVNANLASIVMIGGLLEAVLLAKVNLYEKKDKIFLSKSAPKDKTGNPLQLKEWSLQNFIELAFEMKWIGFSIKDVSHLLRDYRNYIHPYKEISKVIELDDKETSFIWDISKRIIVEIVK